jgi:hypothetical protein
MHGIASLRKAVEHPVQAGYLLWSRLHLDSLVAAYRMEARRAGIDRLYLIVSFDCDTPDDIAAASVVHARMRQCGITPAYAVPGELLREGAEIFRSIARSGAEFLNHGGRKHTYFDEAAGEYRSNFFYDQQPLAALEEDLAGGDRAVREVLGAPPRGFRTPHFGTFQAPTQLRFLHRELARLGYAYSSSTAPFFGWRHGPVFDRFGLKEIPVSGGGTRPFTIIDSWGCFAAPDRQLAPENYRAETVALARRLAGGPGLLNYYADPSHVIGQPIFFETMAELARLAAPVTFTQLLARLP